jgi:hypothetical protein
MGRGSKAVVKILRDEESSEGREDQPNGRYANGFTVGHNAFEFLLDFYQTYAEDKPALLHTRIITAPVYAKGLLALLQKSIDQYEQVFGTIRDEDNI